MRDIPVLHYAPISSRWSGVSDPHLPFVGSSVPESDGQAVRPSGSPRRDHGLPATSAQRNMGFGGTRPCRSGRMALSTPHERVEHARGQTVERKGGRVMRALRLPDWKTEPELVQVPEPQPGPGQVVIKVGAAG